LEEVLLLPALGLLINLIDKHIRGINVMTYIKPKPTEMDEGKIEVTKSSKAVYVEYKDNKGQVKTELYIRALNTTRSLSTTEIYDYVNEHWGNKVL
jgi:hypothetical protein